VTDISKLDDQLNPIFLSSDAVIIGCNQDGKAHLEEGIPLIANIISRKGYYYDALGIAGGKGEREKEIIKATLLVNNPNNMGHFDDQTAYLGMGKAIGFMNKLYMNQDLEHIIKTSTNHSCADVIRHAMSNGIRMDNQALDSRSIDEFIALCALDAIDLSRPKKIFNDLYSAIQNAIWSQTKSKQTNIDNTRTDTALGKFAYFIEKRRRKILVKMAFANGGAYFLYDTQIKAIASEF